jgi:large subunit ribosomal protein L29
MQKIKKLREMSDDELLRESESLRSAMFKLRLQKATGQLEKPHKLRETRRDIARVETLLKEREMKSRQGANA